MGDRVTDLVPVATSSVCRVMSTATACLACVGCGMAVGTGTGTFGAGATQVMAEGMAVDVVSVACRRTRTVGWWGRRTGWSRRGTCGRVRRRTSKGIEEGQPEVEAKKYTHWRRRCSGWRRSVMRGTGRRCWRTDKLRVEGHQATLLRGWLTQAEQQCEEMTMDRKARLTNVILLLKEKAEETVRERVALRREREELRGDNTWLFGKLELSKATEVAATAKGRNLEVRLAMTVTCQAVTRGTLEEVVARLVALERALREKATQQASRRYWSSSGALRSRTW